MSFACRDCAFQSSAYEDSQSHANEEGHTLTIHGRLTNNKPVIVKSKMDIADAAREKAREAEIMRRAAELGLVEKKRLRNGRR